MHIVRQFSNELKKKRKGVYFNSISGINAQILYIKLESGVTTCHSHPNEQLGYILSGEIELTINGESFICKPNDAYCIPPNVEHGFKVLNDKTAEYLEIFSPIKEENI